MKTLCKSHDILSLGSNHITDRGVEFQFSVTLAFGHLLARQKVSVQIYSTTVKFSAALILKQKFRAKSGSGLLLLFSKGESL